MSPKTLATFKERAGQFASLYTVLVEHWNGKLKNGNDATYPVTVIVSVLVGNIAFNSTKAQGYEHTKEVENVKKTLDVLKAINEYEGRNYMVHYAFNELWYLWEGLSMSEEEEDYHHDTIHDWTL